MGRGNWLAGFGGAARMRCALLLSLSTLAVFAAADPQLSGVSFAVEPGILYVSVRDLGKAANLEVGYDEEKGVVLLGGKPLKNVKQLPGAAGSVVRLSDLRELGATFDWDDAAQTATVHLGTAAFQVKRGEKKVVVDKATQTLTAYQGEAIVLQTHISTGRPGHNTPNGKFTAGPVKDRIHYSHLYDEAPMPYSVQVDGNVFIHGYSSVPRYPASHGCVRMPLGRANPARQFYEWVDIGTPVTIQGEWRWKDEGRRTRRRRPIARARRKASPPAAKSAPLASVPAAPEGRQAEPIPQTNR